MTCGSWRTQPATWGLATLVEVHSDEELDRALAAGAQIIGVNNRNLRTLEVDVDLSQRIAARFPSSVVAVSESGLKTPADLARLGALGYRAFLIGERFMTTADPGAALAQLLAEAREVTAPVGIKICGITRLDDAFAAAALDVDALGFVLWAQSPRATTADTIRPIVAALPPFITPLACSSIRPRTTWRGPAMPAFRWRRCTVWSRRCRRGCGCCRPWRSARWPAR